MKSIRRASLTLAFGLATALAGAAHAQEGPARAWAEAKSVLPKGPTIIFGVNIPTIRASQLAQQFWNMAKSQKPDVQKDLDQLKASCGFDIESALQGVVVAFNDKTEEGVGFFSVKGVDQPTLETCVTKMAKDKNKQVTFKKMGKVTEVSSSDSKDKAYLSWRGKDVVVVSNKKPTLQKMLGGKGALAKSADVGKMLGKVNTNAAVWGVVLKEQKEEKFTMKGGYGSADLAAGNINGEVNVIMASAQEAEAAAKEGIAKLEEAKKSGQVPPQMTNVVKSIRITSAGDTMTVKATVAEKDIQAMLSQVMGGMGFGSPGQGAPPSKAPPPKAPPPAPPKKK